MTCCCQKGEDRDRTRERNRRAPALSVDGHLICEPVELALQPIQDLGGVPFAETEVMVNCISLSAVTELPDSPAERCEHFAQVVRAAYGHRRSEHSLVVFVAPEGYFSHNSFNIDRRYNEREFEETIARLRALSEECPDMMIVAGSIVWMQPPPVHREPWEGGHRLPDEKKDRIHNTCPILLNRQIFCYHKKDDIDLINRDIEIFDIPPGMHGVFRAAGRTMGISICGDSERIKTDYAALQPDGDGVDVYILIAIGQGLSKNGRVMKHGGLAIRADSEARGCSGCELHVVGREGDQVEWADTPEPEDVSSDLARMLIFPPIPHRD